MHLVPTCEAKMASRPPAGCRRYNLIVGVFVALLPLFPLDVVLLPGTPLPLHIFEPRYKEMIGECLANNAPFGVACTTSSPARVPVFFSVTRTVMVSPAPALGELSWAFSYLNRSEEHTSELQSLRHLVCRLL